MIRREEWGDADEIFRPVQSGEFTACRLLISFTSYGKKSQKIPLKEIKLAEKRKKEYLSRR